MLYNLKKQWGLFVNYFKEILSFCLFVPIAISPVFYTIKSEREFNFKLGGSTYSFVCFLPMASSDDEHIKAKMKILASCDSFQKMHLVVLFVPVNHESPNHIARQYGYKDSPLFVLFRQKSAIAVSDLNRHYVVHVMKKFVLDALL